MHQTSPTERRPDAPHRVAAARRWHAEAAALRDSARAPDLNTTQQAQLQRSAILAERKAALRLWPQGVS